MCLSPYPSTAISVISRTEHDHPKVCCLSLALKMILAFYLTKENTSEKDYFVEEKRGKSRPKNYKRKPKTWLYIIQYVKSNTCYIYKGSELNY